MALAEPNFKMKRKVGVVGLGYVGLPFAIHCSKRGYPVIGFDQDIRKVDTLKHGASYISYISDEEIKGFAEQNTVTCNFEDLNLCDIIVVCVPTPLTPDHKPDYSHLDAAAGDIAARMRKGQLIIVESTVECGTTTGRILPVLESSGLQAGRDFFLAFSPERVDPGNQLYSLENTPKLVSGATAGCLNLARAFYEELGMLVVTVSSPEIAEMAKLLENTYRDVNIAFINELADICRHKGISVWEVIDAASTKPYGFQTFYPGPGVGGHCIPVDSIYYTHSARHLGVSAVLAETARIINATQPLRVVQRLELLLNSRGKQLAKSKILLLGVTYKKDINDVRESPSLEIFEMLLSKNAQVSYHDPFIENISISSGDVKRIKLSRNFIQEQDCVVVAVGHSEYNWTWLKKHSPLIFDLTNTIRGHNRELNNVIGL